MLAFSCLVKKREGTFFVFYLRERFGGWPGVSQGFRWELKNDHVKKCKL